MGKNGTSLSAPPNGDEKQKSDTVESKDARPSGAPSSTGRASECMAETSARLAQAAGGSLASSLKMMGTGDVGSGNTAAELAQGLSHRPKVVAEGTPMKLATGSLVPLPVATTTAQRSQDAAEVKAKVVEKGVQDE